MIARAASGEQHAEEARSQQYQPRRLRCRNDRLGANSALPVQHLDVPADGDVERCVAPLVVLAIWRAVPVVTRILPSGAGYLTTILPALENFPTEDVVADTRHINAFIESQVLKMPEQYYWVHKRFKTRPEGEASPYA